MLPRFLLIAAFSVESRHIFCGNSPHFLLKDAVFSFKIRLVLCQKSPHFQLKVAALLCFQLKVPAFSIKSRSIFGQNLPRFWLKVAVFSVKSRRVFCQEVPRFLTNTENYLQETSGLSTKNVRTFDQKCEDFRPKRGDFDQKGVTFDQKHGDI